MAETKTRLIQDTDTSRDRDHNSANTRISEGLMHVASWYRGPLDQRSLSLGNKCRLATTLCRSQIVGGGGVQCTSGVKTFRDAAQV